MAYLDELADKINKKENPELAYAYLNKEGVPQWSKWIKKSECDSNFLDKANNRTILSNEIVIDIEDPNKFQEVSEQVRKDFKFYEIWKTGSKGYHIHLLFSKELTQEEKLVVIKRYNGDEQKGIKRCMIALENKPHWKTGNPKTLIESKEGINKFDNINPDIKRMFESIEHKKTNTASVFTNRHYQFDLFYNTQPIFYDKGGLWWMWDNQSKSWKMTDEVDILNLIEESSGIDIINSKTRNETINSLKQYGRKKTPNKIPLSWIYFKNGLVDINDKELKLIEPTHEYFITNPIPYNLGDTIDTPILDKIFTEWVGEKYVDTLYEIIAYCLYKEYPIHRIFCFIGSGLNGKSKYLELIQRFIGYENCTSTELDILLNSRFEITKLHKKMVCMMGETNFNEMSKTSILKKLTGNDLIGFEYKNKIPFDEKNYAKILISTNNLPTTTDKTIGFFRRWMIIDFINRFNEKKDILLDIPEQEFDNLALKCIYLLRGLLVKREFVNEGTIEDRQKRYEDRSNPIEKFWNENIEEEINEHIFKYEFREKLNEWLRENKFREISDRSIAHFMTEKKINDSQIQAEWFNKEGKKPTLRAWLDIKWKDSKPAAEKQDTIGSGKENKDTTCSNEKPIKVEVEYVY